MASSSEHVGIVFTAQEVADICAGSDSDGCSDIDSETGGISSSEEEELDNELDVQSDPDFEAR